MAADVMRNCTASTATSATPKLCTASLDSCRVELVTVSYVLLQTSDTVITCTAHALKGTHYDIQIKLACKQLHPVSRRLPHSMHVWV